MAGDGADLAVGAVLAEARAHDDRAHEAGDAANRVHDAGAGEVDVAVAQPGVTIGEGAHPRVRVPAPVHHDGVDEAGDDDGVDEVGRVLRPSGQRPCHDGGGGGGEGELEEPVGVAVARLRQFVEGEVAEPDELVRGVAYAVGESPANEPEGDTADTGVDHVLHQDVRRLLRADEARREHGEAGLHEEHKEARDQQPGGVDGADDVGEVVSAVLGGDHGNNAEREQTACKHGGRPAQGR